MKRVLIFIAVSFIILLMIALVYSDITDWTLREKIYEVEIPITITDGTIAEIESQVQKVALNKYPDSHLGNILLLTTSNEGFRTLTEGTLDLVYCKNLGNFNGYYNYDRFVITEVRIDLSQKKITRIRIYGNNQLGYFEKFDSYPDMEVIRSIVDSYCSTIKTDGEYSITRGYINILRGNAISADFTIQFQDGYVEKLNGTIKKFEDEYMFFRRQ